MKKISKLHYRVKKANGRIINVNDFIYIYFSKKKVRISFPVSISCPYIFIVFVYSTS